MSEDLDNVEDIRLKKLADLLRDVDPERVKMMIRKDATLQMRLTEADKDEIKITAGDLGISVSEYLLRCHWIVSKKLSELP